MTSNVNPLAAMAAVPTMAQSTKQSKEGGTWFEAMARAWGEAMDNQANTIEQQSNLLANGQDTPATITELTAQSLKMGFLSNSSHTAISSVGSALETMARKQ